MNYWERWVGDWKRKTAHLSPQQKGLYGELLDHQYATEGPLPLDRRLVYRLAGAETKSERADVDMLLVEMMQETESGYWNRRASEEIEKRRNYVEAQRGRANLKWEKERERAAANPKGNGAAKPDTPALTLPEWIDPALWASWIHIRPAKARTHDAQAAAVAKLEKFRAQGQDANAVIRESLANGWQGLFATKGKPAHSSDMDPDLVI